MAIPAPTLSAPTTDYMPNNVRRYVFAPTIANPSAPTTAEISAGIDYTPAIHGIAGFQQTTATISNESFASDYMTTIPGMRSSASSTWTLKASKVGTDARAALTGGTNGFVVIFNEGIVAGQKCDVWPVRIMSNNTDQVAGGALATLTVEFSMPSAPSLQVAVPTV